MRARNFEGVWFLMVALKMGPGKCVFTHIVVVVACRACAGARALRLAFAAKREGLAPFIFFVWSAVLLQAWSGTAWNGDAGSLSHGARWGPLGTQPDTPVTSAINVALRAVQTHLFWDASVNSEVLRPASASGVV